MSSEQFSLFKRALAGLALCLNAFFVASICAEEPTLLEKIQALPFVSSEPLPPIDGFEAFGGEWSVKDGIVSAKGDFGSRMTFADPQWQKATRGVIEVDIRFKEKSVGFSGICFKITDSGIGADDFNGYELGFNPGAGTINVGAHRHNYVNLDTKLFDVPIDRFFRLRIEFEETGFRFYIDGEKYGEYAESEPRSNDPLRAGTFALRLWQNDVEYRDIKVALGDAELASVPLTMPEREELDYPETLALDDVPPFIYVARSLLNQPYSVGNDLWQSTPKRMGCAIRKVDPADPKAPIETIFEDAEGSIYDMNLSFDAQTIYFSYRPKDNAYWNIWKIGVDGSGLTQLTNGPFFDVSPAELPDGGIVFVSTRRFGRTVCQPGPASNLFRMAPDGKNIKCVSMNTLSDFNPQVLSDGRVLFTRWEYIDRDLTYRQSLWTQNQEGTLYQLYYGNTIRDFGSILQARPIPGAPASKVIATFTPHHGYPHGAIGVVDRSRGIESGQNEGFTYWTREFPDVRDISRPYSYRDPFPIDEDRAFCAFGSSGGVLGANSSGGDVRYRVWLLDSDGEKRLMCEEPELDCFCPIALVETPRPPILPTRVANAQLKIKLRPELKARELESGLRDTDGVEARREYMALREQTLVDPSKDVYKVGDMNVDMATWGIPERTDLLDGDPVGQVVLADVYQGLEPIVKRGEVKKLRIMEQIRKTEELYDRSFDQSPSMSVGTYYAKRCWGEVPVEEDGSANFYVPALREIYFQALDAQGREIQRMTSAVQFMQGESIGCIGCHEDRDAIPATAQDASKRPTAALRAPDVPALPKYVYDAYEDRQQQRGAVTLDAGVLDYMSLVQPVLDRYCVSCHEGADPAGGCDLTGDMTRFFCESYDSLVLRSRSYRQADMQTGELLDGQKAHGKPLVQFYWLLWTTSNVNVPYTCGALASRLPEYFEEEHCKAKVDEDSMGRVNLWLSSNAIYQGTYAHARPASAGRRDRWAPLDAGGRADWFEKELAPIYNEKCANCHQNLLGGNRDDAEIQDSVNIDWTGRFGWINLSHPENSALLTAHLPKEQGGRGLSIDKNADKPQYVFETKDDPNWRAMLKAIQKGNVDALARPEADRPGFHAARPEP